MSTLILLAVVAVIYILTYAFYGRYIQNKIVVANNDNPTPAVTVNDKRDFVPTNKFVLFGHHFASIAGAGPIVGPIIALVWGWGPALLWILFGNILIGAVHDYLSLMVSVRFGGKSIQHIASQMIKPRTGKIFAWFILLVLILVIAAFSAIVANTFVKSSAVAMASIFFILAAFPTGILMYKTKLPIWATTIIGLVLISSGVWGALTLSSAPAVMAFFSHITYQMWLAFLFVYIIIAASIPVNILLQPRDYLNSWLLYAGLFIGIVAIIFAHKGMMLPAFTTFSAPAIDGKTPTPFWPAIPLIIACGSLSGFHSLVASGTTAKQLKKEKDGLFVGFGGMLIEGVLSAVVILLVGSYFGDLHSLAAGGDPITVFAKAYGAQSEAAFGFSASVISLLAALWVAAFAMTTLDTTNRIARYIVTELTDPIEKSRPRLSATLRSPWIASLIPAALGVALAWTGSYKVIWPAFGGANQMLASIALITVAAWVINNKKGKGFFVLIPAVFLWITVTAALFWFLLKITMPEFLTGSFQGIVLGIGVVIMLVLNVFLIVDFVSVFKRKNA